jgi:hypothetical protein
MKTYNSSKKHKMNKGRGGKKEEKVQDERTQVLANEEESSNERNFL